MRMRSHNATLGRFYLDALHGVAAVRAHGAARALMREQEGILVQWADAGRRLQVVTVSVEAIQAAIGAALAVGLVTTHVARQGTTGSLLLVTYWALQLPVLAQSLAVTARQLPAIRNTLVRVLEPLGAPEETEASDSSSDPPDATVPADSLPDDRDIATLPRAVSEGEAAPKTTALVPTRLRRAGVHVRFRGVDVRAGGHMVLTDINLDIEPGTQVGVVGASGAGKSTLIGLLLGWHRPANGELLLDGAPLTSRDLAVWRRRTAWVDPAVQLFNRPLVQNVLYGNRSGAAELARAIDAADLRGVLERLPEGLQTLLGEGGALVSGGEGQRVRLARAWLRDDVRLVLLDEPFRGLDREKRRILLDRAQKFWAGATMICVTHDVADTLAFNRVLVVESGQLVEDGDPRALACDLGSRYHAMLANEQLVRESMWASPGWRRIRIEGGQIHEQQQGEWMDLPELLAGAVERDA
jgi:ATP-binding cassette subfamily B protein